jgi:hypothetical protein
MQLTEFENAPTKERHPAYSSSLFYTTAPEWSTGEVLLAAAYRGLILGISENTVDLANISRTPDLMGTSTGGRITWAPLLTERGGIASPLRHGQHSPMASRQLMPLAPQIARIAGVLGKKPRSRWNPTNLLLETIGAGLGKDIGENLTRAIGGALEITTSDDIFSRFVEESLRLGLVSIQPAPIENPPYKTMKLKENSLRAFRHNSSGHRLCPAERFCKDIGSVLDIKSALTRRQWTVLMEAQLRIGLGLHVLWTCNANIIAWEFALSVASGNTPPSREIIESAIWETPEDIRPLLQLGSDAEPLIERMIERYTYARTGLNLLLCRLDDASVAWPTSTPIGFSFEQDAPAALTAFFSHIYNNRQSIDSVNADRWLIDRVSKLFDKRDDLRELVNCKSGYTKNLFEFTRHTLGQVKAKDADQRCYDLAYLLAYSNDRKPMPVQPGPAMLVMLVHACCAANPSIPVSLDDFRRHLGEYGLHVPAGELLYGKTGRDLTMLGLVVDSPDAAGGRLLVKPF